MINNRKIKLVDGPWINKLSCLSPFVISAWVWLIWLIWLILREWRAIQTQRAATICHVHLFKINNYLNNIKFSLTTPYLQNLPTSPFIIVWLTFGRFESFCENLLFIYKKNIFQFWFLNKFYIKYLGIVLLFVTAIHIYIYICIYIHV